jgi:Coatomer epsilon subunit
MSVIFRTLKKLTSEPTGVGKSLDRVVHRKKIFVFNAARHSLSSVLLLLVVFVVLGAGSLFGYYRLVDKNSKKVEAFSISNTDIRRSTNTPLHGKINNNVKKPLNASKPSVSNSIEYRPPDANHNGVKMNDSDPSIYAAARFAAVKKTTETSHVVSKSKAKQPHKSSTSQASIAPDVRKVFFSNAKKNAKIARLITDIQFEMNRGDKDRIEKLFEELAMIKGQNNSYILKLKAVWHIRNKEYADAANLLEMVLSRNELDLEAGLNMAIVEIRTGKEQNAYRRLKKLQKSYPDSIQLAEILQDLTRLFNGEQVRHFNIQAG